MTSRFVCRFLFFFVLTLSPPLLVLFLLSPPSAHADGPVMSPDFPAGTQITVLNPLANVDLDCMWNFDCSSGAPLAHTKSQEKMKRQSGWGETMTWVGDKDLVIHWTIFVSFYPSEELACRALKDFGVTLDQSGFHATSGPTMPGPKSLTYRLKADTTGVYVLGYCAGTQDVEAIVAYPQQEKHTARTALVHTVKMTFPTP